MARRPRVEIREAMMVKTILIGWYLVSLPHLDAGLVRGAHSTYEECAAARSEFQKVGRFYTCVRIEKAD
jgi:hypothetical protein